MLTAELLLLSQISWMGMNYGLTNSRRMTIRVCYKILYSWASEKLFNFASTASQQTTRSFIPAIYLPTQHQFSVLVLFFIYVTKQQTQASWGRNCLFWFEIWRYNSDDKTVKGKSVRHHREMNASVQLLSFFTYCSDDRMICIFIVSRSFSVNLYWKYFHRHGQKHVF